ncbi:MAG: conjugative transfer protein MobI(A/C) [Gimesia sp.]
MEGTETSKNITIVCDVRVEELKVIGQKAVDDYWTVRLAGNQDKSIRRKSNMGCRIVSRGTQFTISWFTNSYNMSGAKIETYSTHLRKGRASFRYSEVVLQKAAAKWELEYVREAEACFALIREELNALAKIRRALMGQKRLEDKLNQLLRRDDFDW